MRSIQSWLRVLFGGIQAVVLTLPFVLHYYGSHTMGAHRHFKVRGDVYLSGILSRGNLAAAAIVIAVLLFALLCLFFAAIKQRPQLKKLWSLVSILLATLLLFLILVLPMTQALLIFPWLLLCVILAWLIQIAKLLLLDLQSFVTLIRSIFQADDVQERTNE